jgi:hypothetical protein
MKYIIALLLILSLPTIGMCKTTINKKRCIKVKKITYEHSQINMEMRPLLKKLIKNPDNNKDILVKWMDLCNLHFRLMNKVVHAVGVIESRRKDGLEIRTGPLGHGTYYGPMGIKYIFMGKNHMGDISNPFINVYVGARALARRDNLKASLQKYNASFNYAYYHAILSTVNQLKGLQKHQ